MPRAQGNKGNQMRVCTAQQMARIDRDTIAAGTTGEVLMERAGQAMFELLLDFMDDLNAHGSVPRTVILCGKGNNGGDGLVVARLLAEQGMPVRVLLLADGESPAGDAGVNLDRLPETVELVNPEKDQWSDALDELLEEADVVVDAILGTGIKPPLESAVAELIRTVNDSGLPCVAVDIPSGVCGDDGRVDPVAVAADLTLTVGLPKLGLLLPPGRDFVGDLEVVDIGFPIEISNEHALDLQWLPRAAYLELLPPRRSDSHKYECGSLLAIGGSRAYGGAAHLMGLGALRSGAGMVTLGIPAGVEAALAVGLPEAILISLAATDNGTIAPIPEPILAAMLVRKQAVAIGPGLGADPDTDAWVVDFLRTVDRPAVVDADGLGAFARTGTPPGCGTAGAVFTPHAGELARLTGLSSAEVMERRMALVPELAAAWGVVLVLKGSPSLIAAPDGRLYVNPSGDDALARGGSGDVLTGLIGGLLAQGQEPLSAALLGTYIHGRAGTLAAEGRGARSVRVPEMAAAIGPVFEAMEKEASGSAALRETVWPIGR
jgi:ADP-dependent NAD(P)H-hydrate dehydratase / NAD(P)H-hydrate epimerase